MRVPIVGKVDRFDELNPLWLRSDRNLRNDPKYGVISYDINFIKTIPGNSFSP